MEKRKVTVTISGHACSFYSDDPDEYIAALEQSANAVMKQTARFSGPSVSMNAILAVLSLTDTLMRIKLEKPDASEAQEPVKKTRKQPQKAAAENQGQVSVWELLEGEN